MPHRHWLRAFFRAKLYILTGLLVTLAWWVGAHFGTASLEQVLYHLQFGLNGLIDTDTALIKSFVLTCVLGPLLFAAVMVGLEWTLGWLVSHGEGQFHWYRGPLRHFIRAKYWAINHRAPFYSLIAATIYFCTQFSVLAFIHHKFGQDYFSKHYIDPRTVEIHRQHPKNLVLIYIESLETGYANPQLFKRNLLQPLTGMGGMRFEQYLQAPGTGWTIAGITSTQCGLPLQSVSLYDENGNGEKIKNFLPRAVCLGDVLHHFGYHNVYMGGDALAFSGKGKFFQDHHFDEVYGRDELKGSLTESAMNFWGLYDDDLLSRVKAKLQQLQHAKQPFSLVVTTIDTHGPDGHLSKTCLQQGARHFDDIVACTATQVTTLIQWMQAEGYLKNTQVVILGDHLAMENPVYSTLESQRTRSIYNQFITQEPLRKTRELVLHFDMFPTILESLGFKVVGGRLGLGYSALNTEVSPPANTLDEMNEDLLNQSEQYLNLWTPDQSAQANSVNAY